jgi:hypothetical protein
MVFAESRAWGQSVFLAVGRSWFPAGVVAGGPLGFLPEGAGEGAGVGGHGPGKGAVAGLNSEVAGEVVLAVPRLGPVAGGSIAPGTAGAPSSMPRSTRWYASSGVQPPNTRPVRAENVVHGPDQQGCLPAARS